MAKKKRFEHKAARPSLAASLEAVRQGRALEPVQAKEVSHTEPVARPRSFTGTNEAAYVKAEMRRIAVMMGLLLVLLITLSIAESRTSLLTRLVQQYLPQ